MPHNVSGRVRKGRIRPRKVSDHGGGPGGDRHHPRAARRLLHLPGELPHHRLRHRVRRRGNLPPKAVPGAGRRPLPAFPHRSALGRAARRLLATRRRSGPGRRRPRRPRRGPAVPAVERPAAGQPLRSAARRRADRTGLSARPRGPGQPGARRPAVQGRDAHRVAAPAARRPSRSAMPSTTFASCFAPGKSWPAGFRSWRAWNGRRRNSPAWP